MDTLSPEQRSALMKRVKRSGTKPELLLRKALHKKGFRYVIEDKRLPGTPDMVFPKYKAAVFVHGCFWHAHSCRQGRAPSSNQDFWEKKMAANMERDARKEAALRNLGWTVFTVWECELRTRKIDATVDELALRIRSNSGIVG